MTYTHFTKIIGLLLFFFVITSCKKNEKDTVRQAGELKISSVTVDGQDVGSNSLTFDSDELRIKVTFSEPLDIGRLNGGISVTGSPNPKATIKYEENNTIAVIHISDLDTRKTYELTIYSGQYGADYEKLKEDYRFELVGNAPIDETQPDIVLSAEETSLKAGDEVTLKASASEEAPQDITIHLAFSGTVDGSEDVNDLDFSAPQKIIIKKGDKNAEINIKAEERSEPKGMEVLNITIESIENGNEDGTQTVSYLMSDNNTAPLILKGVMAMHWAKQDKGWNGKMIHFVATEDIPDLSKYGYGLANNGGGTKGVAYTFDAQSVSKGDNIIVNRAPDQLSQYFGNCWDNFQIKVHNNGTGKPTISGDDAVELYKDGEIIEIFGDRSYKNYSDQTLLWDYTDSWAYKNDDGIWIYGGSGCITTSTEDNASASCVYPLCN